MVLDANDYDGVLTDYGEALDISREDLEMLYLELAGRAKLRTAALVSPEKLSKSPGSATELTNRGE